MGVPSLFLMGIISSTHSKPTKYPWCPCISWSTMLTLSTAQMFLDRLSRLRHGHCWCRPLQLFHWGCSSLGHMQEGQEQCSDKSCWCWSGSAFIKPDQLDPWIKDQIKITLLLKILHLLLPNFVSCGRACPSHMAQNLVTVGAKLWTAERFLVDPWSMDYADPVW